MTNEKKEDPITEAVKSRFDFKTIGIAALLSGGLGIGGGFLGQGDGVSVNTFETLEKRSEKRYKRGMEFGAKMETALIKVNDQLQDLRVEVAELKGRLECEKDCK